MVAVWLTVTALALAVNVALVPCAGIVSMVGTVRNPLLLDIRTPTPFDGAGALTETVQVVLLAPAMVALPHVSPVRFEGMGTPVPVVGRLSVGVMDVLVTAI